MKLPLDADPMVKVRIGVGEADPRSVSRGYFNFTPEQSDQSLNELFWKTMIVGRPLINYLIYTKSIKPWAGGVCTRMDSSRRGINELARTVCHIIYYCSLDGFLGLFIYSALSI